MTERRGLQIANAKLKELGINPIEHFNGGWGASNTSPFFQDIPVPDGLKSYVKRFIRITRVHGYLEYHWKYCADPCIVIETEVRADLKKKDKDGKLYLDLGEENHRYTIDFREWKKK